MDKNGITLSQAIEGYFIAAHARRLSRHTLRDYDTTFRRFETWLGRDPPLRAIDRADIRAFLNSLDNVSDKTVLNLASGACRRIHNLALILLPYPERNHRAPRAQPQLGAFFVVGRLGDAR
jgi:site-specific recombinase XerD